MLTRAFTRTAGRELDRTCALALGAVTLTLGAVALLLLLALTATRTSSFRPWSFSSAWATPMLSASTPMVQAIPPSTLLKHFFMLVLPSRSDDVAVEWSG